MFSAKKLLLIGFVAIILIAIPVTVYLLQQQQEVRSRAQAATKLEFIPASTPSNPIQAKVGDPVDLDIYVDPSSNLVSFVKLEIQYDSTKLATVSGDTPTFENNNIAFPSPRGEPDFSVDGKVILSVSVGPLPTSAVKTRTKVGTLHFQAKEKTDTPTQVIFGLESQVLSVASTDQASENVLVQSALQPAIINISDAVTPTESPTPTIEEPTPTDVTPTVSPTATANKIPVCTLFTATPASGSAPLDVNFSVSGDDEDGTIAKYAFNFGDNNVTTVTSDATNSSNSAQTTHTYSSGGVFTASAVLTDNAGGTSVNTCSQTVTIAGPSATPSATTAVTATPTTSTGIDTPTPTLESPGPGATIIGLGAFFTVLSVIGAVLFFAI